jgi:hypothetical protein
VRLGSAGSGGQWRSGGRHGVGGWRGVERAGHVGSSEWHEVGRSGGGTR